MRPQKINVIVYAPRMESGKAELAERVASVHADLVLSQVNRLHCSGQQKKALLDAILADARERCRQEKDISPTRSGVREK